MIMVIITGCGKKKVEEPKVIENNNSEVISDKVVDGIDLKNTSLTYENGISTIITSVTNNTESD